MDILSNFAGGKGVGGWSQLLSRDMHERFFPTIALKSSFHDSLCTVYNYIVSFPAH